MADQRGDISTKERLGRLLDAEGLSNLAVLARFGRFDDFDSESATPIMDLVNALRACGRDDLAERAMSGEWDATADEGKRWAHSPEGQRGGAS